MARKKYKKQQQKFDQINDEYDNQLNDEDYSDEEYEDDDSFDDVLQDFKNYQSLEKQMTKKRRSKEYYVKGKDLIQQIRKYQESLKNDPNGKGYISEQLGEMILKICTRFSLHPKFFGYTYRDEMVADAVMRCLTKSIARIDLSLENCNPFSYFTQTALNCFRGRINSQKKFMKAKQRFRQQVYNDYQNQQGLQHTKDNDEQ